MPRGESRIDVFRRRRSGLWARGWLGTGLEHVLLDFQVVLARLPAISRVELDVACGSTSRKPNWPQGSNVESDWRWQRRLRRELMWTNDRNRKMKLNEIDFVEWIVPAKPSGASTLISPARLTSEYKHDRIPCGWQPFCSLLMSRVNSSHKLACELCMLACASDTLSSVFTVLEVRVARGPPSEQHNATQSFTSCRCQAVCARLVNQLLERELEIVLDIMY